MPGQYNVDNTKKLLDFVFVLGTSIKVAGADGKYDLADLGQLMPIFVAASQSFGNVSAVPKELGELDEDDAKDIIAFCQQRLPGVVDKADLLRKIAAGLSLGLELVKFISELKKEDVVAPK